MERAPLAIDLFCGLGGWTEGLLAEGYFVVGFDIEQHVYGEDRYLGHLVIQDALTLHGSQFKDATLIVASPPCQEYSYMAMPWARAKAKAAAIRADETGAELERLNALFNACFRLQREACEASGRHIPMVVENVRGAIPWVGRSRWAWGSFHLWGDIPALMPPVSRRKNDDVGGGSWFAVGSPGQTVTGGNPDGRKVPGFRFDGSGRSFQTASVAEHVKVPSAEAAEGRAEHVKSGADRGGWFGDGNAHGHGRQHAHKSKARKARKAASAKIAKIPEPLARHIARVFKPRVEIAA